MEWVADSRASNHTMLDPGNISLFRPPNPAIHSSIIVGNESVDTVLPRPVYLNNVLVTPNIIKNFLFVHQFTTNNWCSMDFDPFDLFVKDLDNRNMNTRCNSSRLVYIIRLPTTRAPQTSTYYTLTIVAAPMSL
jgi:hypothetical protein